MRVLHLISTLEGGGAERQLSMLAAEQARRGWEVHVALRRGGLHRERMRNGKVTFHEIGDLRGPNPLLIARVYALVRRVRPSVLQTWLPQMDIVGGAVALMTSVPWILSERSSGAAYEQTVFDWYVRPRLAHYAKAIVANSVNGAEYWTPRLPAIVRVTTVDNAVDAAAIRNTPPISCQPFGGRGHVLLFVGHLLKVKAPDVLIQAISHLAERDDICALLIGDGPLSGEVYTSISAFSLENRVSVLPYQANWWGLLKTATALVSTSRFEGQPNVVLEAMAAGCPLIVSDIPAHRAILDESAALFVPRDNSRALADAIVSLMSNLGAARQRADLASKRVAAFTIQAAADAYEQVYARVLKAQVA